MLRAFLAVVLSLFGLVIAQAGEDESEQVLRKAVFFSLGTVGRGGGTSAETKALHALLARPDAVARFESMLASENLIVKAYGLAGLKYLKHPKYEERARATVGISGEFQMITGDVVRRVTLEEFIERLDRDYADLPGAK